MYTHHLKINQPSRFHSKKCYEAYSKLIKDYEKLKYFFIIF